MQNTDKLQEKFFELLKELHGLHTVEEHIKFKQRILTKMKKDLKESKAELNIKFFELEEEIRNSEK